MEQFQAHQERWNEINRSFANHILLEANFVDALLRHFGGKEVRLGISADPKRPGMALLASVRWGIWETFQPSQAPLGLIVLGYKDDTREGLRDLMRSLPGYPLQLGIQHQDPDFSAIPLAPQQPNLKVVSYIETGSLSLEGTFDDYWSSRSDDLKKNNARRRRRLADQGKRLEFLVHSDPSSVAACIRSYGVLESQGWKAQGGTAVAEGNAQGRFYREVMEMFCGRGEGTIFELLLDGKTIASELWVGNKDMRVNLKTTFDETLKQLAPGFLMKEEIIRWAYSRGDWRLLEFYGRLMEWHTKWIGRSRTLYHVNYYPNRWVPKAREAVRRLLRTKRVSGAPPALRK
jgi:hypothetical protein